MNTYTSDFIVLKNSSAVNDASTWILVLSAANIPHLVDNDGNSFKLLVPENEQLRADHELASYYDENRHWPPKPLVKDSFSPTFLPFSFLIVGLLAGFYMITGPWSAESQWFAAGAGKSEEILYHFQWQRLITPLTLHADLVHLTGNCIIGGALLHFLCKSTGNGIGLLSALIAAILGNLVNVLFHGLGHHFVGFSTLVFAVIGIQTAIQFRINSKTVRSQLRLLAPFMAGFGLLAVFGSSGERTDLGAHFFGLLSGIGIGVMLASSIKKYRDSAMVQFNCTIIAVSIILGSWFIALS